LCSLPERLEYFMSCSSLLIWPVLS
jgi:hypothetical protein